MAASYVQYLAKLREQAAQSGFKVANVKHRFSLPAPLLKEFLTFLEERDIKPGYAIGEAIFQWLESQRRTRN